MGNNSSRSKSIGQRGASFLNEMIKSCLYKFCPVLMSVTCKPHSLGNDYYSIAYGDEGNPVMYRIKIQEGKDRTKDANRKWAFPSKFEVENTNTGRKYTKTSSLMCDITVPLHVTGKFCQWTVDFL